MKRIAATSLSPAARAALQRALPELRVVVRELPPSHPLRRSLHPALCAGETAIDELHSVPTRDEQRQR